MINFENGAPFDPGFAPLVYGFTYNAIVADNELNNLVSLHQKKFRYKIQYPQILKLMKNTIAFYQGCLMWAYVISKKFQDSPIAITGNFSLGKNPEEYDFLAEVNYLIDYLEKIEKDAKYYLSQNANIPEYWKKIVNTYREFLQLNKNFTSTERTNEIKLPAQIENANFNVDEFIFQIDTAITENHIEKLLETEIL